MKTIDMHLTNKAKHWVFKHYLWIGAGVFVISLLVLANLPTWPRDNVQVKFMIIGIPFTFLFLVQKRKLEETRLFKELFNSFNARYDSLNEDLNRIRTDTRSVAMAPSDRDVLYNYFNLCAEEHLFRSFGYIPEEVWDSWWEGMKIFFSCTRIRREWDTDPGRHSYYGFVPPEPSSQNDSIVGFETSQPSVAA
jgi:hypothetical protein